MIESAMWLVAVSSVVGNIANIYKKRWGFAVWAVGNVAWVVYDAYLGAWAQAALFVVYFGLAVWGFLRWRS